MASDVVAAKEILADVTPPEYECPVCGCTNLSIIVLQSISVEFKADGDAEVFDGPNGDMEWDGKSDAYCTECGHYAKLGKMKRRKHGK